ncbi:MAG: YebC/PmpR family DNA-binding transcriptional regulator [Flexibacteraceae bacterium]
MGRAFEFRKGRKMKRWGAMSKAFSRLGKEIIMAVREGGPSPDVNYKLRMLIQNSRAVNMPKENVERAIKKATDKDTADIKQVVYEGYGPFGIAVVVETATDNTNRTVAAVRSIFTRAGGALGTTGSLDFLFDKKCVFKFKADGLDMDELELEMIDAGGEEIFADEDGALIIYGGYTDFNTIQKFLEEKKIEIISAEFERIPTDTKELNEEQQLEVEKMLDKLEEDDDVQNVYHNMR